MKVLYAPARQRVPSKAFEWSNGTYSLLLDKLELDCGVTLEEDFAELLDATLEEDFTLLLDFALELDFALTEEEDLAELLDTLVSPSLDCGVTSSTLLDDSSSCGAKLLSSSQAARKQANANANTKRPKMDCIKTSEPQGSSSVD